jgi:hypothetical protein
LPEVPQLKATKSLSDLEDHSRSILRYLVSLTKEVAKQLGSPELDVYTVSELPSAGRPGQLIYVSDETGGSVVAFSDGTDWRRVTDRAVVS